MTDLIVGEPFGAVQVALRRGLARKSSRRPVVVLDYTGRSNAALDLLDRRLLAGRQVQWFNLGDRRRPFNPYLFREEHRIDPALLGYLLAAIASSRGGGPLSPELMKWLVSHWLKLISIGPCDIVGFGRSLRTLEGVSEFALPDQAEYFLVALDRAISTPVLQAAFQSEHIENPADSVGARSVTWLEIPTETLDAHETQLLGAFGRTLLSLCVNRAHGEGLRPRVIQLHPPRDEVLFARLMSGWLNERADHVLASRLDDQGELVQAAGAWMATCDRIFHVRSAAWARRASRCPSWLSPQSFGILRDVTEQDVWCYHRKTAECLVVSGNIHATTPTWSQKARASAAVRRPVRSAAQSTTTSNTRQGRQSLRQMAAAMPQLRMALQRLRRTSSHRAGSDGVGLRDFLERREPELRKLHEEVMSGDYRCRPVVRVHVPKGPDETRPLGILTVRDRVLQSSVLQVLNDTLDHRMSDNSFAFRPGRNVLDAVLRASDARSAGAAWVVRTDIRKCFEHVNHLTLLSSLERFSGDESLHALMTQWLHAAVVGAGGSAPTTVGVEQGSPLSPMLVNAYLDPLDRYMSASVACYVRYADDILLACESEAQAVTALERCQSFLGSRLAMQLNHSKTRVHAPDEACPFLGCEIRPDGTPVPARDRVERLVDRMRDNYIELAHESGNLLMRQNHVQRINSLVGGFERFYRGLGNAATDEVFSVTQARLDALAQRLLPPSIQTDPVWQLRLRLNGEKPSNAELIDVTGYDQIEGWGVLPDSGASAIDELQRVLDPAVTRGSNSLPAKTSDQEPVEEDEIGEDKCMITGDILHVIGGGLVLSTPRQSDKIIVGVGKSKKSFSLDSVSTIVVHSFGARLTKELLCKCGALGKRVVLIQPSGNAPTVAASSLQPNSRLRARQAMFAGSVESMVAAKSLLLSKIHNQQAVLRYFGKYRKQRDPGVFEQLSDASHHLKGVMGRLSAVHVDESTLRATLLGHEGHAAAIYWSALRELVPAEYTSGERTGRGAEDAFNQCLNLTYSLLYAEVWNGLISAGLDPHFGCLHGREHDEGSAVFDMIEPFRAPFGDRLVCALFGRGFKPELNGQNRLRTPSRRKLIDVFYRQWRKPTGMVRGKKSAANELNVTIQGFRNHLVTGAPFRPFRAKW